VISLRQIFIIVSHYIPDKRFQMVRYYGGYFNKMRWQHNQFMQSSFSTVMRTLSSC